MRVEKLLKRLRREFIKVNLIQAALDSILIFLSLNIVLFLLNVTLVTEALHYRILAALTFNFMIADWVYRSRKYRLEIYEEQNPQLQEILRTARDNLENQNIVSQAMFDDLMERARSVTSESIIPGEQILKKIVFIGILAFLTALSGIVDYQIQQESQEILQQLDPDEIFSEDEDDILKNASEIYGEERDVEAVSTDLEINITGQASGGEMNPLSAEQAEEFTFEASDPNMPEDVELAKEYSLKIQEIE